MKPNYAAPIAGALVSIAAMLTFLVLLGKFDAVLGVCS